MIKPIDIQLFKVFILCLFGVYFMFKHILNILFTLMLLIFNIVKNDSIV